jgi:transmembrane sensor
MKQREFRISFLLARVLRGELTPIEKQELDSLLSESEQVSLLKPYEDEEFVNNRLKQMALWVDERENKWYNITQLTQQRRTARMRKIKTVVSIAAVLIATLAISIILFSHYDRSALLKSNTIVNQKNQFNEDINPGKVKAELTLSDGRVQKLGEENADFLEGHEAALHTKNGVLEYLPTSEDKSEKLLFNTLRIPKAGVYRVVLSDGTAVWLNALSELHYPVTFGKDSRKVYLKGEGYFEVAHDKKRPFSVVSGSCEVLALGTAFNIESYRTGKISTILVKGKVRVSESMNKKELSPGELAVAQGGKLVVTKANLGKVTWKDGYFYFDQENIEEVMEILSRWYDVDVRYSGSVPKAVIEGTIDRNTSLSEALNVLKDISGIKSEITGRTVIIK